LLSIDGAGTRQEKLTSTMRDRKLEDALGTGNDGGQHFERSIFSLPGTRFSSCVNDKSKFAVRKLEAPHITAEEIDCRIGYEMRAFSCKCFGATRENRDPGIQLQEAIHMAETLHQPATEKPCTAGEKQAMSSEFVPEIIVPGGKQIKVGSKPIHKERQCGLTRCSCGPSLLANVESASIDRLTE
jgi:hypothetical protein